MLVQTTKPKMEFYHVSKNGSLYLYYIFSPEYNSQYPLGQGLINYNYQISVNQFTSQWSCQIKENPKSNEDSFYDKLEDLDVVKIYENGGKIADYIGLITTRSFQASSSGPSKTLNISGKGIEYLFEFFNICLDATAMAFSNVTKNIDAANAYKLELDKDGVPFKDALESIFIVFRQYSEIYYSKISNVLIGKMINACFGYSFLDVQALKFNYPISSNMFSNTTINYVNYVRQLLPSNVYEFHGIIKNGVPKLKVRENPFSKEDWKNLNLYEVNPLHLTDYTLTRSIDEVYTVFMAYLEGSTQSADYYRNIQSSSKGYDHLSKNESKIKKYGYKLLTCNFRGFNTALAEDETAMEILSQKFEEQNEKLKEWYDHLDELYDATITIVNVHDGKSKAKVGDRLSFISGQFYVTGEDHQWMYGSSPKITYHCERGGLYNKDGSYAGPIKKITTNRIELQ